MRLLTKLAIIYSSEDEVVDKTIAIIYSSEDEVVDKTSDNLQQRG